MKLVIEIEVSPETVSKTDLIVLDGLEQAIRTWIEQEGKADRNVIPVPEQMAILYLVSVLRLARANRGVIAQEFENIAEMTVRVLRDLKATQN